MYITYNEVLERYPMLKTWAGNSPMLATEITYAENEINGRLSTHYSTPFSGAHPTIKDLAIDLTYFRTLILKDPDQAVKVKEFVLGRIDGLKNGDEYIMTDSNTYITPEASKAGEVWTNMDNYHPVFSMLNADDPASKIDPNRIDAEENERR